MERVKSRKIYRTVCLVFASVLVLYPLRHICTGVDLWDGGYNYANFMFAGTEYMDSMWYYATWIATSVGSLLMKLPFADTMQGMNIYTGLFVSLLASAGFLFCVRILKLPCPLAFLAEITACSLCWAPTSALYNYLTFLLLMGGSVCLYLGLLREREGFLAAAGILLGLNVGVRFSNLVHMGLILAVWLYGLFSKKKGKTVLRETGVCVLGYGAGLGGFLLFMGFCYGLGEYADGILRLFQMTEAAADYTPAHMLAGMLGAYYESTYWVKRFLLILAAEMGVCVPWPGRGEKVKRVLCVLLTGGLVYWLSGHSYYSKNYAVYDAIEAPCVMVLAMTLCLSVCFLIKRETAPEEKLPAAFAVPTILLTPLGGNNAVYYSFNNMFLVLPFLMYMFWKLCREHKKILLFPAKTLIGAAVLILFVQALGFGRTFVYEEAAGGLEMTCEVEGIPVLRGMRTNSAKAQRLTELYRYLEENGLRDKRVILYGGIPGVAYYMELVPALNIWGDLRSYSRGSMQGDLEKTAEKIGQGEEPPLVILEHEWAGYLEDPAAADAYWDATAIQKLRLIGEFMEACSYEKIYDNEKYVVYTKNT